MLLRNIDDKIGEKMNLLRNIIKYSEFSEFRVNYNEWFMRI